MMFVFQSAIETLKKYADFNGRASREEFWCFFVFVIIANAVASFVGLLLGALMLSGIFGLLLVIPQVAVAVRRLHDLGKSGRELVVPCVMLLAVPLAFAFRGILPKIVALGFLGLTLLVFANLLTLFLKKGTTVPNRYGAAPTAFSFARQG
jgi:uncharacterized membrane protein YhaH (DUF805 family)